MKIDESDFHDHKDRLFILQKKVNEHLEDREDMIMLLKLIVEIAEGTSKVSWQRALVAIKTFLNEVGEL